MQAGKRRKKGRADTRTEEKGDPFLDQYRARPPFGPPVQRRKARRGSRGRMEGPCQTASPALWRRGRPMWSN